MGNLCLLKACRKCSKHWVDRAKKKAGTISGSAQQKSGNSWFIIIHIVNESISLGQQIVHSTIIIIISAEDKDLQVDIPNFYGCRNSFGRQRLTQVGWMQRVTDGFLQFAFRILRQQMLTGCAAGPRGARCGRRVPGPGSVLCWVMQTRCSQLHRSDACIAQMLSPNCELVKGLLNF